MNQISVKDFKGVVAFLNDDAREALKGTILEAMIMLWTGTLPEQLVGDPNIEEMDHFLDKCALFAARDLNTTEIHELEKRANLLKSKLRKVVKEMESP